MARKIDFISSLAKETAKEIVKNEWEWKRYLNTAARLYKYPFQEQVLIYAQRPEATACASIEIWNEKMNCWVNKGAKGIALIDEDAPFPRLKYVFDVEDVHKARRIGRDPYLWQMREEHEEAVIRRLEKIYGATNAELPFVGRLLEIAEQIALDTYEEIAGDMRYLVEGSFLEGLDEYSMKIHLRDTLQASIFYTLLTRCGLDAEEYKEDLNFEYIHEFNTLSVVSQLGTNTTELCKPVLMEIGKAIRAYDREMSKKGLVNTKEPRYNTLKRESKEGKEETETVVSQKEPSIDGEKQEGENDEYGIDVSEERRLLHPEYPDGRAAGDNPYKVWNDEEELSEGTQEGDLFGDAAVGQTDETSAGDSGNSREENGTAREPDGESRGSERGTERERPDALDTDDEQHPAHSGGNSPNRADLQLNTEQKEESDSQKLPDFFDLLNSQGEESADNILRGLLCFDDYLKVKRTDIAAFFITEPETEQRTEFIKKAYNKDYSELDVGSCRVGYKAKEDGLVIWAGNYLTRSCEAQLSWSLVREHIDDYLTENMYLMPGETIDLPEIGIETGEYQQLKLQKEQEAEEADTEKTELPESEALVQPELDTRLIVAVENTEDYADPSIGFFTYHYQDGREGIRYRLVTIGEDGRLEAYPEANKFFINEAACREYIANHVEDLRVISYDEIVHQAGENLEQQIEVDEISESEDIVGETGEAEEQEQVEKVLEQPENNLDLLEPDLDVPEARTIPELEIDTSHAANYRITNDTITAGSPQEKFDRNIAAITTLQLIESEKRTATPEEQEILAGYVGWGGLSEAFDERNGAWHDRYLMLKGLLNEQEYSAARESTLTAHYTSPIVIRSIYEALGNMGFEKGNVLEPSMGVGNFFGMLPAAMAESRLYGVELDSLTGRIAKQLYPKARIQVTGFEKTDYPDDFFDVAVGNVPFGDFKVFDRKYDKYNLLIHDYFFTKSIDKVRQGGVVAMISSNGIGGGTFDKRDSRTRRYIAQRCDLLGAIRLPRGTFEEAEITTDILFFQKRERQRDLINDEPDWVQTTVIHESDFTKPDGEVVTNRLYTNNYFLEHPEMVLGKQEVISGPFGPQLVCTSNGESLEVQLKEAVRHIQGSIENVGLDEMEDELEKATIPADPEVKNYSYTVIDGEVYYREDSVMKPVEMSDSMLERIKGMVAIRNVTNDVINYQLEEYGEAAIKSKQVELSEVYDSFTKKLGLISSQTNKRAFNQDSSYCLLCSLEVLNEDGTLKRKADMFTKRTIKRQEVVTSVDTPTEALAVSMSEKACVDIGYMAGLLGGSENYDRIVTELSGIIFKNPLSDLDDPYAGWETGDEYLSGNVREKLEIARLCAENRPEFTANVIALERVQPKQLDASEIEVRLGATWVESRYIDDFMQEVFETPKTKFNNGTIGTQYSEISGQWNIKGKSADFGNPLTEATYGTGRANAYKILEDSLNLRDSRIFDTVMEDGREKRVLNKKETMLVSQKQEAIREAYKEWVFRDAERREVLCKKYNELFNSNRPREYDGSHLNFPGMSPNIAMRPHQKNAVAHQLYGNNTLLAHCVGAGKTFEMAAAAMESKRLGLAQKSLFVVPNHLTGQWASEFLTLYPGANILAATKKDFEPANRKKFCSRIATGDYDAVIIGHSQFEKIPLSRERQAAMIEHQVSDITLEIESLKSSHGERYTIKQMEKTKKSLLARLERLNDRSRKDDVVTFEQLGVDRLFVDESHSYKNLFLYTKMRNIAGIAQTEAQKSSDMFAKCQYMDELTGGKGVTFATGTPISNSMTELYTNMRYLQFGTLQRLGLGHFDSWAASFGETITAIELAPEGTGYRAKTRFAKFFNLPELISIFKEAADIQTPDMLNLPVPDAVHENVVLKPSEYQQDMVKSLADRAEDVRNGNVDATIDNMLKITNDGRKLALDQRLIDALLPDESESKVVACVERAVKLWENTTEQKAAQLIFCDLSTPKNDGTFNVYHDIKDKLVSKGVPPEEIAFIHDGATRSCI